jgi:very-short-patch-repair endonuclease
MGKFGIIVLRVTNSDVETSPEKVIRKIKTIVTERLKSSLEGFRGKKLKDKKILEK